MLNIDFYSVCEPQFRYDLSKGLRPRRSVRTAMQHEIMMYSIVQKEGVRNRTINQIFLTPY